MADLSRPIRLAIVDDDPLVRAGLRILLGGSPDIEVVAEGGDGAEAVSLADAHWPDVILMDITRHHRSDPHGRLRRGHPVADRPPTAHRPHRRPGGGPRRSQARASLARLTDREREVAVALGRGMSNAEISAEVGMSIPTVKGHVSRLLTKLELNNRAKVALLIHDAERPW